MKITLFVWVESDIVTAYFELTSYLFKRARYTITSLKSSLSLVLITGLFVNLCLNLSSCSTKAKDPSSMFFFKAAVSQKTFSLSTDVFIFFCSTTRQFINAFPHPHPHPLALVVNKSPGHSISIQLCTTISKEKKKDL